MLELPRLHPKKYQELCARGIVDIADVPADLALNELQHRAKAAAEAHEMFVSPALGRPLAAIRWPCYYLDFEDRRFSVATL